MVNLSSPQKSVPWLGIGMGAIFLVSLGLRFWQLSQFNSLVFDEVYYAKFASAFLQGKQDFGGHPPLSTYLVAGGIWLAERWRWGDQTLRNSLTGLDLSTFSYRWLNAGTGALIPLVVGAIAFQLTQRRGYALIAALFAAVDGIFLVESRYALNNIYLVLLGLLGHWLLLLALARLGMQRSDKRAIASTVYLVLSGVAFGGAIAIKWNGVAFLAAAYGIWIAAWVIWWAGQWAVQRAGQRAPGAAAIPGEPAETANQSTVSPLVSPLAKLTRIQPITGVLSFAVVPFVVYWLSWLPYMQLDPSTSFWGWQAKITDYHSRVGGMDVHPYCSPWYSWFLMVRPVAYFYKTAKDLGEVVPGSDPSQVIYDVHAMGNPFLWWFSTLAMVLLIIGLGAQVRQWLQQVAKVQVEEGDRPMATRPPLAAFQPNPLYSWTALYLSISWIANWILWVRVTRCTFLYHYMGASIFSLLGLALVIHSWLQRPERWQRRAGIAAIAIIVAAFLFWLPLYLGLPISSTALQLRRWFPSWI